MSDSDSSNEGEPSTTTGDQLICYGCYRDLPAGLAVVLRNCQHQFCIPCLKNALLNSTSNDIECPYDFAGTKCSGKLEEDEVAEILEFDEEYFELDEYGMVSKFEYLQILEDDIGAERGTNSNLERAVPKISTTNSSRNTTGDTSCEPSSSTSSANKSANPDEQETRQKTTEDLNRLTKLSDEDLSPNQEPFECPICNEQFEAYKEVMLKHCFHKFCKKCLTNTVKYAEDVEVECPALVDGTTKCTALLLDREIRALMSKEEYDKYQEKCVQKAEAVIRNTAHCLQPNCPGWVEINGYVDSFECPVCSAKNCTPCKAIHTGKTCYEYTCSLKRKDEDLLSEQSLQKMQESREGMRCPTCGIMIMKIAGCDYMTCTKCKTGLCWPTRGARWGPGGKGDTSGGCRCKVDNGRRCHPECEGCH